MHVNTSREPRPDSTPERRAEPPPPPHEALLRLQRAAGNQAVARLLQRARTQQVPAATFPTASNTSLFVKQVEAGVPDGAPLKLGQTDPPPRGGLQLPEVWAEPADGGFELKVSPALDRELFSSVSVPPGEIKRKAGVTVTLLSGAARVEDAEFPPGAVTLAERVPDLAGGTREESVTVIYVVSPEEAALIRENEQQHPDDFARAFEISAQAVARAARELAGQVFPDAATAMRALVALVDKRLVPDAPLVRSAWARRLMKVLAALYDLSGERDERKEHNPKSRHGTLDLAAKTLTMGPDMTPPGGQDPAALVTLDNAQVQPVSPDYDIVAEETPPPSTAPPPPPVAQTPAGAGPQPLPATAARGQRARFFPVADGVKFYDDEAGARSGTGNAAQESEASDFAGEDLTLEQAIGDSWLVSKTDRYGTVYAVVPAGLLGM
jgi:hypothetical protein